MKNPLKYEAKLKRKGHLKYYPINAIGRLIYSLIVRLQVMCYSLNIRSFKNWKLYHTYLYYLISEHSALFDIIKTLLTFGKSLFLKT